MPKYEGEGFGATLTFSDEELAKMAKSPKGLCLCARYEACLSCRPELSFCSCSRCPGH